MSKPEEFCFVTNANIALHMNLYRAGHNRKNITILYLHGGGLIYGTRDDLPAPYLDQLSHAGYDLLAVDYPLAPETRLGVIIESVVQLLLFYADNQIRMTGLNNKGYVLFGRSAGAYLALVLCDRLREIRTGLPLAIISLYGYARLDDNAFYTPSTYYQKFPRVSEESMAKIIADTPVTYGPMDTRFSLYLKARQAGTWISMLCGAEAPEKYSLDAQRLATFPPTFLAAATMDPDVPYKMSKQLRKQIPYSHLITIYGETHDFDRNAHDEPGRSVYREVIKWLNDITARQQDATPAA